MAGRVVRVVVMGGGRFVGNATSFAEFNTATDPEAAERVLGSGLEVTVVPLDITRRALLRPDRFDAIRATGRIGSIVAGMLDEYAGGGAEPRAVPIHDALALAELIDPGVLETSPAHVSVDCSSSPSRGETRFDLDRPGGGVRLATEVDAPRFIDLLISRLASLDAHPA